MTLNKEEQIKFVRELFEMEGTYDLRINVWYPSMEKLDWLLQRLKVKIHIEVPHILNLYDGDRQYTSPTEVCVFLDKKDVDEFREHPKLKDLYNKWYFNKQKEENKTKKGGEQINEGNRKSR